MHIPPDTSIRKRGKRRLAYSTFISRFRLRPIISKHMFALSFITRVPLNTRLAAHMGPLVKRRKLARALTMNFVAESPLSTATSKLLARLKDDVPLRMLRARPLFVSVRLAVPPAPSDQYRSCGNVSCVLFRRASACARGRHLRHNHGVCACTNGMRPLVSWPQPTTNGTSSVAPPEKLQPKRRMRSDVAAQLKHTICV